MCGDLKSILALLHFVIPAQAGIHHLAYRLQSTGI